MPNRLQNGTVKVWCKTKSKCFEKKTHYYRKGVGAAWHVGLRHGGFCLGCCWAMMLVMFGVGVGNLAGMAALTGAMVIEKAVPGGKRLSPFIGITLLLLGVLWLAHPVWLRRAGI